MSTKVLKGNEITQHILERLARLESILICQHCEGTGKRQFATLGLRPCNYCEGAGNRLDELERRL